MNLNELEVAYLKLKGLKAQGEFRMVDFTGEIIEPLLTLTQQVLDVKGLPLERGLAGIDQSTEEGQKHCWHIEGYNQALNECKLAHTKVVMELKQDRKRLIEGVECIAGMTNKTREGLIRDIRIKANYILTEVSNEK